jgi:hypothetical protein
LVEVQTAVNGQEILCAGGGYAEEVVLHGSANDPAITWVEFAGTGRRANVVWPHGYFARFSPQLVVFNAGGTIEANWPLKQALEIGDRATGFPVLHELYDKMKAAPAPVDLKALWKQLGVQRRDGKIEFDDAAPLASVRKAITRKKTR